MNFLHQKDALIVPSLVENRSGLPEEDENVKGLIRCWHQQQQSTGIDKFTSVMLIWAFGSGELIQLQSSAQIDRRLGIPLCVI